MTNTAYLKVVAELVNVALDIEQLNDLCLYNFRPVYELFKPEDRKNTRIRMLIEYADRTEQLHHLIQLIKEENPRQYDQFASRLYKLPASKKSKPKPLRKSFGLLIAVLLGGVILFVCLGGAYFTILRSLNTVTELTGSPTSTSTPQNPNQGNTVSVEGDVVDSTIIQNIVVPSKPTETPLPGPTATPNAYALDIENFVQYSITEENTLIANLDGYGPHEIVTSGGIDGLPHVNIFAFSPQENGWTNVMDTLNLCGGDIGIIDLKHDGTKHLVVYGSCGTGAFVNLWIYEYRGLQVTKKVFEFTSSFEPYEDGPCAKGVVRIVNEKLFITPFYHLASPTASPPQICAIDWDGSEIQLIPENLDDLPYGTQEIKYWLEGDQLILSAESVEVNKGGLIRFVQDTEKYNEPCTGEIHLGREFVDFTEMFGVIRAKQVGITDVSIKCNPAIGASIEVIVSPAK